MTANNEDIVELINSYEKQSKALKQTVLKMCWHMRGGLTYDEAMAMGYQDRLIINEIIEEHMEVTKDSGMPFF